MLAANLRQATAQAHRQAEGASFIRRFIDHALSPEEYAGFVDRLLVIYRALEAGLDAHADHPCIKPLWWPELRRVPALEDDQEALSSLTPSSPPGPHTIGYGARLRDHAERAPHLLVAHAYVRYLGDLAGGQGLARHACAILGREDATAFYRFDLKPVAAARDRFRAALDALPLGEDEQTAVVEEARVAFRLNQDVFSEMG